MTNLLLATLLCVLAIPLFGEVTIIGHRGSPCNAPENTLASFRKAMEAGADYIEFDVHLTKDKIPIVTHDPMLGRTVNVSTPIAVHCLTLDELKQYDAGVNYHQDFIGEKVPTLDEVFTLVQGKIGMMIEIKTGSADEFTLAETVMKIVKREKSNSKDVLIASFSPKVLQRVKEIEPKQSIIALAKEEHEIKDHQKNNPEYYGLSKDLVTEKIVSTLHKEGRKVWVWTVNSEDHGEDLVNKGVDGLITNRPMALMICKETVAAQSPR